MRPFRISLLLSGLVLLTACAEKPSMRYELTMDSVSDEERQSLVEQSIRVIERRLDRLGAALIEEDVQQESGSTILAITTDAEDVFPALSAELTSPFSFAVMREVPVEEADITVEGHGGFKATDITGKDLLWINARENEETKTGEVRLVFTEIGRTKMAELFKNNKGKFIGIFVREKLISKLLVDTDTLQDDIVIQGIPDPAFAEIFADDVNVGIHVTFIPLP